LLKYYHNGTHLLYFYYALADGSIVKKPNKKRNPFAKQLKHFTSKVFKNKKRYDRKKLATKSIGD
jgi:hypothetical protein